MSEKIPEVTGKFILDDESYVVIQAGNINIRFEKIGKDKIRFTNKWNSEVHPHRSAKCDVPHRLFVWACRVAAEILLPKIKKPIISSSYFGIHR